MNQKEYIVTASNQKQYNIRLCEIVATGSESKEYDKLFIIYKTPEGEFLKRVKHFHPKLGSPEISYELISGKEFEKHKQRKFV